MLKPRDKWRAGMTYEKLIAEMDSKLQFPGLSNTWTMPVENRLDMELTGIETPVGLKVQGPNLDQIQQIGSQIQQALAGMPEMRSAFAEKVAQGFYVNIEVNRDEAARYGLTVGDVQRVITSGIGGMNIAENVEGRERYPVNVRYERDFRDNLQDLGRVLVATSSGAQIPIVGDKVYTLKGDKSAIDKYAGEKATVKGTEKGETITVSSISAPKK